MFFSNQDKDQLIEMLIKMLKKNNEELRSQVRELKRHTCTPEEIDGYYQQGRKDAQMSDSHLDEMTNDRGEIEFHCPGCGDLARIPVVTSPTIADMVSDKSDEFENNL